MTDFPGFPVAVTIEYYLARPIEPWRLDLIARYSGAVARYAPRLEARYPGYDVEPMMFQALYLAAFTWEPGPAGFYHWYRAKLVGATAGIRRQIRNRSAGLGVGGRGRGRGRGRPFAVVNLDPAWVDDRLSYRDPEPREAPTLTPRASIRVEGRFVVVSYRGQVHRLKDWEPLVGIPYGTLYARYRRGWCVERIFGVRASGRRHRIEST